MPERAIFLDRDNTVIDNDGYLGNPAKVRLLPGAATALAALRSLGYRLIVVSNQSGVARGMFDEAAVEAVNEEMGRQLKLQGAYVDVQYYCPYHPEAVVPEYRVDHEWRKPRPGMLKQAAADFSLDLTQCWMIGDAPRDIAAGAAVGCRTILLKDPEHVVKDEDGNGTVGSAGPGAVSPNYVVKTLADAARIIAREGRTHPPLPPETAFPKPPVAERRPEPPPPPPPAPGANRLPPPPQAAAPRPAIENQKSKIENPIENPIGATRLERHLEELTVQLRQQNRHAELKPEFSQARFGALIVQGLAVMALGAGLFISFSAKTTFKNPDDWSYAALTYERAIIWVLVAVVLEGVVLALLIHARHK